MFRTKNDEDAMHCIAFLFSTMNIQNINVKRQKWCLEKMRAGLSVQSTNQTRVGWHQIRFLERSALRLHLATSECGGSMFNSDCED